MDRITASRCVQSRLSSVRVHNAGRPRGEVLRSTARLRPCLVPSSSATLLLNRSYGCLATKNEISTFFDRDATGGLRSKDHNGTVPRSPSLGDSLPPDPTDPPARPPARPPASTRINQGPRTYLRPISTVALRRAKPPAVGIGVFARFGSFPIPSSVPFA